MCYAKPGPRCSTHAKRELVKLLEAHELLKKQAGRSEYAVQRSNPYYDKDPRGKVSRGENKMYADQNALMESARRVREATALFESTPAGQRELRELKAGVDSFPGASDQQKVAAHAYYDKKIADGVALRKRQMDEYNASRVKKSLPGASGVPKMNLSGLRHVLDNGTINYRNAAGELHREDGPAVVFPDGEQLWYLNDNLHRPDGPAVVLPGGTEEWYLNGKCHREDGPAIVSPGGTEEWYLNGKRHREDGPAFVMLDGTEKWFQRGKLHRIDGPAVVYPRGTKEWYRNGKRHREDGPAVVSPGGTEEWYLNGELYRIEG